MDGAFEYGLLVRLTVFLVLRSKASGFGFLATSHSVAASPPPPLGVDVSLYIGLVKISSVVKCFSTVFYDRGPEILRSSLLRFGLVSPLFSSFDWRVAFASIGYHLVPFEKGAAK